jgi:hypothetical protein
VRSLICLNLDRHGQHARFGRKPFSSAPLDLHFFTCWSEPAPSRLFKTLAQKQHQSVALKPDDLRVLKAWIDLNCPLWPDGRFRNDRPL